MFKFFFTDDYNYCARLKYMLMYHASKLSKKKYTQHKNIKKKSIEKYVLVCGKKEKRKG